MMNYKLLIISVLFISSCSVQNGIIITTGECELYKIEKTIDGDTLVIKQDIIETKEGKNNIVVKNVKIRMIGIDTPETVHPDKDVEFFGIEASKKMKKLVEGKEVCLKRDFTNENKDKYNRLLRYVFIGDLNINQEMIRQGYAHAYTRFPFSFMQDFIKSEKYARNNNLGLWDQNLEKQFILEKERNLILASKCLSDGEISICPENAKNYIGKIKTVRFLAKNAYDSGETIFINSHKNYKHKDNFTAVIFKKDISDFNINDYKNKVIEVSGRIIEYGGIAEIIVEKMDQIKNVIE